MNLFILLAVALLVLGVIGSFTPMAPGAAFSILGILLYWWSTGFTRPGIFFLAGTLGIGVLALLVDWFGGAIAAKQGGASTRTTAMAAIAGFLLMLVSGPAGLLIGIAGTVFIREYLRTGEHESSVKAAVYGTAGVLASGLFQALLTGSILVAFLVALLV
ncbi:MAG: DUF456 domain-containing protein [Candidatus Nanohaloarchaea archaeon]